MPFVPPQREEIEGHNIKKFLNKLSGQPASYSHKANYVFGRTIGAGSFGVVRQARNLTTKEQVAVKIVLKKALKGKEDSFYEELALLRKCNHPHIVGFRDWFEAKDKFYIVTQLALGGELFDRIVSKGKFTERDAMSIIKQVLDAVWYLHNVLNIVHRDLKPENLLYISSEDDSPLVLADFGIAKELKTPDDYLTSAAGSMGYCAPEVLIGNGHGRPCDIWSLGVITYTLLCGYSPFRAENVDDFLQEVDNDQPVVFHREYWENISDDAKDFIVKACTVDQKKRATADELLHHSWLVGTAQNEENDLLPNIKKFNAKKKFRQAVELIKLNNRVKKLRSVYQTETEDDSDLALVEDSPTNSFNFSNMAKALVGGAATQKKASQSNDELGDHAQKSDLNAGLFHQIVRAATENREKVLLAFKEEEEETNKKDESS